MKNYRTLKGLFLCAALFGAQSFAQPQHFPAVDNLGGVATLWRITFYDDTALAHTQWATQDVCFVQGPVQGSNTTGLWYSTTYNRWLGRYRQEGDQVVMTGDFWKGPGNDAMNWEITVTDKEGFGHWEEWIEDGAYGNWLAKGNTKIVKVGRCQWQPPVVASLPELEKLVIEQADLAPLRTREDGLQPYPGDPKQLPLLLK